MEERRAGSTGLETDRLHLVCILPLPGQVVALPESLLFRKVTADLLPCYRTLLSLWAENEEAMMTLLMKAL